MPKDLILKRQLSLPGAIKALPGGSRVTGLGPVGADAADQERMLIVLLVDNWFAECRRPPGLVDMYDSFQ